MVLAILAMVEDRGDTVRMDLAFLSLQDFLEVLLLDHLSVDHMDMGIHMGDTRTHTHIQPTLTILINIKRCPSYWMGIFLLLA